MAHTFKNPIAKMLQDANRRNMAPVIQLGMKLKKGEKGMPVEMALDYADECADDAVSEALKYAKETFAPAMKAAASLHDFWHDQKAGTTAACPWCALEKGGE